MSLGDDVIPLILHIGDEVSGVVCPCFLTSVCEGVADWAIPCVVTSCQCEGIVIECEGLGSWHAIGFIGVGHGDVVATFGRLDEA